MLFVLMFLIYFQLRDKWARKGLYAFLQMIFSANESDPCDERVTERGRELESRFQALSVPGTGNRRRIQVNYIDPTGATVPLVVSDEDKASGGDSGSQSTSGESGPESSDEESKQRDRAKKTKLHTPPRPQRLVMMPS